MSGEVGDFPGLLSNIKAIHTQKKWRTIKIVRQILNLYTFVEIHSFQSYRHTYEMQTQIDRGIFSYTDTSFTKNDGQFSEKRLFLKLKTMHVLETPKFNLWDVADYFYLYLFKV